MKIATTKQKRVWMTGYEDARNHKVKRSTEYSKNYHYGYRQGIIDSRMERKGCLQ